VSGNKPPALRLVASADDEILARLYQELEVKLFDRKANLLERLRPRLEMLAALALGGLAATVSMVVIFIVVNNIFHYQP
jgi:hypothetical protein